MTKKALTLEEFEEQCRPSAEAHERDLHDPYKTPQEWGFVMDHNVRLDDGRRPLVLSFVEGDGFYLAVKFPVGEDGWYIPLLKLGTDTTQSKQSEKEVTQTPDKSQK